METAPAGSTPTIRTAGVRSRSQVPHPPISPPPPTGRTIVPTSRPCSVRSWSTASSATVPCPAMISGWSKGGTGVAPVRSASSAAASAASSKVSPTSTSSTRSPPIAVIRSRFWRGVLPGT